MLKKLVNDFMVAFALSCTIHKNTRRMLAHGYVYESNTQISETAAPVMYHFVHFFSGSIATQRATQVAQSTGQ